MSDFIIGLGFFLFIEGLAYALAPRLLQDLARKLPDIPPESLRWSGLVAMLIGLSIVWIVRG